MIKSLDRKKALRKRHNSIRHKITGVASRPRLAIFKSTKHIYAQVIDDVAHKTLVSASSIDKDIKTQMSNGSNIDAAAIVGKYLGEKAVKAGITEVVFDRGGFLYHGRVAKLADAAREAGLIF